MEGVTASRFPQYVAAISATIGGVEMGSMLGWMSPASAQLEASGYSGFNVTQTETSLLGGAMPVGAMLGSAVAGHLADTVGRRTVLLVQALPWLAGWALILWAQSIWMMCGGRLVLGGVIGLVSVVAPMYVNEISQTDIQGTLGVLLVLQSSIGIIFVYVLGKYATVFWLSVGCALITVVYLPLMMMMPESPRYHLMKRHPSRAEASLQWLRGRHSDVRNETIRIQDSVDKAEKEKVSMRMAFTSRAAKRGLLIGIGLMVLQQFCGVDAILFYTVTIFQEAGSTIPAMDCTIIVGCVAFIMTFLSAFIVDRLGRKPLLLFSCSAQALSCLILGVYYFLKDSGHEVHMVGWLPLFSVGVFVIAFAVGLGPIPWLLMVEVFPAAVRGPASSLASLVNWFGAVVVTTSFSPLKDVVGAGTVFCVYAVFSALGVPFVAFLMPETKGKNIDEVTAILAGHPSSSAKSSSVLNSH